MPINTRSMRSQVKQSPAASAKSTMKTELRPVIRAKLLKSTQKTKTTEDPVPGPSKRVVQAASEVSRTKNPRQFEGFNSVRSKPNLKDVYKTDAPKKNHDKKEKPLNLQAKYGDLGNFFGAALTKRREFYELFKDTEESFNKDFEFTKKLLGQKNTVGASVVPLSHTPLGSQLYTNFKASSALRINNKLGDVEGVKKPKIAEASALQKKLDAAIDEANCGPSGVDLQSENLNSVEKHDDLKRKTPSPTKKITANIQTAQNSGDITEVHNVVLKPLTSETSKAKEKSLETPSKDSSSGDEILRPPSKVLSIPVIKASKVCQDGPKPTKRLRSPEESCSVSRTLDKLPPSFEFGVESPGRKKLKNVHRTSVDLNTVDEELEPMIFLTDAQNEPGNAEPIANLANVTYVPNKPGNTDPPAAPADATYIQTKPGGIKSTATLANATYVQKKPGNVEPAIAFSNATYVQKKDDAHDVTSTTVEDSSEVSEELFSDEDLKAVMGKNAERDQDQEPILPKGFQDKKSEDTNSTCSSVSALVERFELKKKIQSSLKTVPPTIMPKQKIPEVVPSSQLLPIKNIGKELVEDNGTFIFETSVVESPCGNLQPPVESEEGKSSLQQRGQQNEALSKVNSTFTKPVALKMPMMVDQTFVVNTNKLSAVNAEDLDSEEELFPPPPFADKTYVKDAKKDAVVKKLYPSEPLDLPPHPKAGSSKSSKSGVSTSSSSSGSMKSAVSQPSLTNILPCTKMGIKNTVTTGSAGSVYEKQKSTAKEAESTYKKRLMEKEEEAAKRKLEIDQRKMELQKKKNEEWKRKAEKMKADEKKVGPMPASAKVQFAAQMSGKAGTQCPVINANKMGKPMSLLKPQASSTVFPSKFNTKLLGPSGDTHARNYEEPSRDDSYRTADGCSFLDVTTDVDPANNYDITRYEDIDEECKHRENKSIPDWARGENITMALFKQIPYENLDLPFFAKADAKFRLFPNFGK